MSDVLRCPECGGHLDVLRDAMASAPAVLGTALDGSTFVKPENDWDLHFVYDCDTYLLCPECNWETEPCKNPWSETLTNPTLEDA